MPKPRSLQAAACYLLAAALLLFYFVTLGRGLAPRGSAEYRAFYLDRVLACWPGENGLAVAAGQTIEFDEEVAPGHGAGLLARDEWQYQQGTGWQTVGNAGSLYLTVPAGQTLDGTLLVQGEAGQEIVLLVQGQETAREPLTGVAQVLNVSCTASEAGERLELRLESGAPITIEELRFA